MGQAIKSGSGKFVPSDLQHSINDEVALVNLVEFPVWFTWVG